MFLRFVLLAAMIVAVVLAMSAGRRGVDAAVSDIQTFTNSGPNAVDYDICYGGAYPAGGVLGCNTTSGSSDTYAGTLGATVQTYMITKVPAGSRLTVPISFTPTGSSNGFTPAPLACGALDAHNECTAGAVSGAVQARTDLLCDATADILATSNSASGSTWPNGNGGLGAGEWEGYPLRRIAASAANGGGGAPTFNAADDDSYVDQVRPQPPSFPFATQDRATLTSMWLSGVALFPITPTPLQLVTSEMNAGYPTSQPVLTSVALTGGNPGNPPQADYLCFDSPGDSIIDQQVILPSVAGDYVRWTIFTSAPDIRSGSVGRILDTQCVHVGPTNVAPVCDLSDADGDLVPAAVENIVGSNPAVADTDADGSDDYAEIFEFTNPLVQDTDGDGSKDKHDTGADETPGTVTVVDDTTADDNCPAIANPSQSNTDSSNDFTQTPALGYTDNTNPHQDTLGDACDSDDDNDALPDVAEGNLTMGTASSGTFCVGDGSGALPLVTISPTNPDSDADLGLDGRECQFKARPDDATTSGRFPNAGSGEDPDLDLLFAPGKPSANQLAETQFRTQKIAVGAGVQTDNPDGDANTTGENDGDSDNDGLRDGLEVKFYGTDPDNPDTDGDGCSDGREAADGNGSRSVNATDLGQIAARLGTYRSANGTVSQAANAANKQNYDWDKNGLIGSTDLGQVAAQYGSCGVQLARTIVNH